MPNLNSDAKKAVRWLLLFRRMAGETSILIDPGHSRQPLITVRHFEDHDFTSYRIAGLDRKI